MTAARIDWKGTSPFFDEIMIKILKEICNQKNIKKIICYVIKFKYQCEFVIYWLCVNTKVTKRQVVISEPLYLYPHSYFKVFNLIPQYCCFRPGDESKSIGCDWIHDDHGRSKLPSHTLPVRYSLIWAGTYV